MRPSTRPAAPVRLTVATLALLVLGACGDDTAGDGGTDPAGGGTRPGFSESATDPSGEPGGTPSQTSADTPTDTPSQTPSSTPGSTPSETPDTPDAEPELIVYAGGEALPPFIENSDDVGQLRRAPDSFKEFIGRAADELAEQTTCTEGPVGFSVDIIRTDGFAIGGVNDCGGAEVLWVDADGGWQEIGATQELWECALLGQYAVPSEMLSLGDSVCYDAAARKERRYRQE